MSNLMTDTTDIKALREHNRHIVAHLTRSNPRRPLSTAEVLTLESAKLVVAALSVRDGLPDVDHSEYWFEQEGKLLFDGALFNSRVEMFISSQLEAERQRADEDGRKNVFLYMAMKQRAEKAEARVKELERQKPVVLLPVAEDYPIAWSAASVLADVKAAIKAAGGIVKDGESATITCWSCKKTMTLAQHSSNDGLCPHCNVEIDLEE